MQIVLLHIQKTAGTTLFKSLSEHFDPEAVFWGPSPPLKDPVKQLVASHLPLRDHDLSDGRDRLLVTSIRDPAERLISLYRYWRSMRWSMVARNALPEIALAKRLDFAEWLLNDEIARTTDNGLVNHFCDDPGAPPATRLAQAKANIVKMAFIFASPTLSEDVERFLTTLGLDSTPVAVVNATDHNPEVHPESFERVEPIEMTDEIISARHERTSLDREFFDFAMAIRDEVNGRLKTAIGRSLPAIGLRRLDDGMALLARGLRRHPAVLGNGWAPVEEWHVWSVKPVANLFFATTPVVRSCELKLQAHMPGGCDVLKTRVIINGTIKINILFVGPTSTYRIERNQDEPILICNGAAPILVHLPIDIGRRSDGRVDIRFEIDNLLSPAQLGLSDDYRLLGVALYSLRCSAAAVAGEWCLVDDHP